MEKLYKVTFTSGGRKFRAEVRADSKRDAIELVKDVARGENYQAELIAIDGEPVNGMKGGENNG